MARSESLPSHRRLDYHYIAMQLGFWAMFAAVCGYQAALLLARGFSNTDVGAVIAVRCLAGIFCQPLLGGFADRHPQVPLKLIVTASLGLSFAAGLLFLAVPMGLPGTLAVFAVVGGFEVSAYPLMDSMAVQYINAGVPIRYSLGRGLGSMSYAVTCVLLGLQVGRLGVESTLVTHAVLVAVEMLLVISYPAFRAQPAPAGEARAKPQSVLSLLRSRPRFTCMLAGILFGLTGFLPMSNFLVNVVVSRGGDDAGLGLVLFVMAGFELPAAFVFQRLMRRMGSARLLVMSMAFVAVKGAALLLSFNYAAVLLCQPLQMLGYGLFTPASVFFVNESVPPADRVRGQSLMMVASNGLGGVLGSFVAGRALDAGGANLMLLLCTGFALVGTGLCALALRVAPERGQN